MNKNTHMLWHFDGLYTVSLSLYKLQTLLFQYSWHGSCSVIYAHWYYSSDNTLCPTNPKAIACLSLLKITHIC